MAATSGIETQGPSTNNPKLESLRLQRTGSPALCPVTTLAFYQYQKRTLSQAASRLLLAGEDGWLVVYGLADGDGEKKTSGPVQQDLSDRLCYGRLRVFAEQAIQGCRVGNAEDGDILVWGGQSVALVSRDHIAQLLSARAESEATLLAVKEVTVSDWIYDGLLPRHRLTADGAAMGALITAHNEILPFRVGKDEASGFSSLVLFGLPISPSRPVLYSAQLAWSESKGNDSLLVVAGTVFGEIVVWTCDLPVTSSNAEPAIKVLDVFTGHEGSIFDVVVSPEFDVADLIGDETSASQKRVRLLASCSDDRTIWVWPLYLDRDGGNGDEGKALEAHATNEARETGFQNTFEGLAQRTDEPTESNTKAQPRSAVDKKYKQATDLPTAFTSSSASSALATVMAHASRIWHVRFGDVSTATVKDGNLVLYSFGEDATAQEWKLELGVAKSQKEIPNLTGRLVHIRTLSSHAGKNIWSAAVSEKAASRGPLVATGGCDGKICLFEGASGQTQPPSGERGFSLLSSGTIASSTIPAKLAVAEPEAPPPQANANEDESAPKPKKKSQKKVREEVFNSYAFLSDDQLLAASTGGRLFLGDLQQTSSDMAALEWLELPGISDTITISLKEYNVVRSPQGGGGGGIAANPGAEGLAIVGNAAGQLFLFSRTGGLQQLATKLPGKVDDIFFLPQTEEDGQDGFFNVGIIATTLFRDDAAQLDLTIDLTTDKLLSEGTRTLRLPTKVPASPAAMVITAASRCLEYIVLGSRNGQICLYKPVAINSAVTPPTFVLETQLQTRTKDAILSIVPLPPRPGQLLLSSSSFVVTARDGTYRIYSIDTTGSPTIRLQHETATPFGPIVRDAWFMEKETPGEPPELVICGFRSTNFVVWNETRQQELATVDCGGTHRTHTYRYCSSKGSSNEGRVRFAFTRQSELHVFAQDVCVITPIKTGGHGREIRSVRASATGRYLATGGEDTVVRIWDSKPSPERRCLSVLKLHNTGLHTLAWLGDDCLISAAGSEELFIWRITTILDSSYDGLAVLCESSYPDSTNDKILRIIGLDASLDPNDTGGSTGAMLISVGLSNSILKTYRYAVTSGWHLLAQGHYTGACPTQLQHLRIQHGGDLVILAAFADGHLTVWKASPVSGETDGPSKYSGYTLLCATKSHQNAVKALDLVRTTEGTPSSTLIFTGGDDNAIAVTSLSEMQDGDNSAFSFRKTFRVSSAHAAAVTGARILLHEMSETGDSRLTVATSSNDQRVKAWRVIVPAGRSAVCVRIQLLDDRYSAIADPGDVESIGGPEEASAIVVGMGMETWSLL
ncbi:WD repeat-containing protein 6 [Sporothrix eucalyptigena]|uniref:WD repeat-containing protein 6 n=1 Tax=Sporothrix eucalyptigena TaxID=1812306 RepID=A0ABP0AQV8_9PEZI